MLVVSPSITMQHLEVHGIKLNFILPFSSRINRPLTLLGMEKISECTIGIAQVSPRLYQKSWLKNFPLLICLL